MAPRSEASHEPQPQCNDAQAYPVPAEQWLIEKERARKEPKHGREEEIGTHFTCLAVLEDPEPEHRGADAEDQHQVPQSGDQRTCPIDVRHTLEQQCGGNHCKACTSELRTVQDHWVWSLAHALEQDVRGDE